MNSSSYMDEENDSISKQNGFLDFMRRLQQIDKQFETPQMRQMQLNAYLKHSENNYRDKELSEINSRQEHINKYNNIQFQQWLGPLDSDLSYQKEKSQNIISQSPFENQKYSNQQNISKSLTSNLQVNLQPVRKSNRIRQKQQKSKNSIKSNEQLYSQQLQRQKHSKRQQRLQQASQYRRPLIQRLRHPSYITLKSTQICYMNNTTYYSILAKQTQLCQQHRNLYDEITSQDEDVITQQISQQQQQNQSQRLIYQVTKHCKNCIQAGKYWFSKQELMLLNNGQYYTKYLEGFFRNNTDRQTTNK